MLDKTIRARYLQAAKELRKYFNGEKFRADAPERAFIQWYVAARFGKLSSGSHVLGDRANDGGIDSIVLQDGGAIVFQMKYETVPKLGMVRRDELAGFEKIAKIFTEKNRKDNFDQWLSTVRPDLKASYRKLFSLSHDALRFVFVTSKYCELTSTSVEIQDIKKILSLWSLYQEGFTPATEVIKLVLESTWHAESHNGFATHVGLADVQDFLGLMKDDKNDRLFKQNVRTDLRSPINREIRNTYERSPEEFWLGNNGIYIVCREVKASGARFELTFPSIINGSQTLHSIAASDKRHGCKILVRILEMDVVGNPKLLSEVIRRTNTQNPMKLINLWAHDPLQLNVALYLDKYEIFYERREKEWINEKKNIMPGYLPVKVKELGQWLSVLDPSIGLGRARSRVSELFQENFYRQIFGDFDSELRSQRYKEMASTLWTGLLIKSFLRTIPTKRRAMFQIPRLLLIRAVADSIRTEKSLQEGVLEALRRHKTGKRKIPTEVIKQLKLAVSKFSAVQKKAQQKDRTLDYSNFFKRDECSAGAYASAFSPMKIKALAKALLRNLSDID